MKATVSCYGKFHAFHLAQQLYKRGFLHKLITTFYSQKKGLLPEFRKDKEMIDSKKAVTNIVPDLIGKTLGRIPLIRDLVNWDYYSSMIFDSWAKSQIDNCDLLIVWSNAALRTLRFAKSCGIITVVERGSTHILFQKEILEDEYDKYGFKIKPVDERYVQDELVEYAESDYISIPSDFAKQTYIERGIDPKKLIKVPYGVDLNIFRPIPKEDNCFRVVFAGTLSLRKGVHYLLEAFSKLKLKNAELLLIGSKTPEINQFLARFKDNYRYIGKAPHLELYKYLSQGSVFVLPSIEEGLAMVIPQAMACGLPIICTTNTGATEIVRDKEEGFVVPIRDIEVLKEKILHLYENEEERSYMSQMSLKRIKGFTWDHYGEKIVECYSKILGK